MTFLSSLVLSLVITLVSGCVPWITPTVNRMWLAIAFVAGLVIGTLITALSLHLYPWTNLVVLLVALSAGILLGRSLPARTGPFLILLLVLSALDITQIVLTSINSSPSSAGPLHPATIPPPQQLIGNLFLLLPWGHFNIGIFDICIIAAMSEHWRKRGSTLALALTPGVVGMFLAFAFLRFLHSGALPLLPFLTLGWLCSLALASSSAKLSARPGA